MHARRTVPGMLEQVLVDPLQRVFVERVGHLHGLLLSVAVAVAASDPLPTFPRALLPPTHRGRARARHRPRPRPCRRGNTAHAAESTQFARCLRGGSVAPAGLPPALRGRLRPFLRPVRRIGFRRPSLRRFGRRFAERQGGRGEHARGLGRSIVRRAPSVAHKVETREAALRRAVFRRAHGREVARRSGRRAL